MYILCNVRVQLRVCPKTWLAGGSRVSQLLPGSGDIAADRTVFGQVLIVMEVEMPVQFDGPGHDGTLEIKRVSAAAAQGELSAWTIDHGVDGGVAAKADR